MRTLYVEGVATHDGPESCVGIRKGAGEALTGVRAGPVLSREIMEFGVPTLVIVRFADDFVAGFEHKSDAEQFLTDLRERFSKFNLELHPDKTRLIEFGRNAARARAARGDGRPETFDFLGFTHMCGKNKSGGFWLRRKTISKRMRAKLAEVKDQIKRRQHLPIPVQGKWLGSVVRGHLAYYAVPGNTDTRVTQLKRVSRHPRR